MSNKELVKESENYLLDEIDKAESCHSTFKTKPHIYKLIFFFFFFSCIYNTYSQWEQCYSGLAFASYIDPIYCENRIFSGQYLSTNLGELWEKYEGFPNYGDCKKTLNHKLYLFPGDTFYFTSDNGYNWTTSKMIGLPKYNLEPIGFVYNENYLYLGAEKWGLFRSTDNGDNWIKIYEGHDNWLRKIWINKTDVYLTTYNGLFLSTDNGNSWKNISSGLGKSVSQLVFSENYILANYGGKIFLSTDKGNSWINKNNEISNHVIHIIKTFEEHFFAITTDGILFSTDNCENWVQLNTKIFNSDFNTFEITGKNVFIGTDQGLYLSTDYGNSWTVKDNGLGAGLGILNLVNLGNNILAMAASSNSIFISSNEGYYWTPRNSGLTVTKYDGIHNLIINSINILGDSIYIGTDNGFYFSTDEGYNWTHIENSSFFRKMVINNNKIYAVDERNGFMISTDNGKNWLIKSEGLPYSYYKYPYGKYYSLNLIALVNNKIIVGSTDGSLYITSDYGDNWKSIEYEMLYDSTKRFNIINISDSKIYLGTDNGLFISSDEGSTWIHKNKGIENLEITYLFKYGSNIFASVYDNGIYLSTDNGDTWTEKNNGLIDKKGYWCFTISGYFVYAGCSKGRVYKAKLSDFNIAEIIQKPNQIVSPVPASDFINIKLNNKFSAPVTIQIYNSLGIMVYNNVQEKISNNYIEIKTHNLSIGSYFCRIVSGNQSITEKFLIVR